MSTYGQVVVDFQRERVLSAENLWRRMQQPPEMPLSYSIGHAPGQEPVQRHYNNWDEYVEGLAQDYGVHQLPNPTKQAMLIRLTPDMDDEKRELVLQLNQFVMDDPLVGREWTMGGLGWMRSLGK